MRKNFIYILILFFILEIYVYQAFKTLVSNSLARIIYISVTLAVYGFLFYSVLNFQTSNRDHHRVQIIATFLLAFLIAKVFIAVFLLIDDIFRLLQYGFSRFSNSSKTYYPERRKFLSVVGFALAGIFSTLVIDGVVFGKYRHRVRKVKLKIAGLPKSFKGYKILQISDLHSGSFFHPEKLEKAVKLINDQNADLVLFTGDMVNGVAEEFLPFVPLFSTIKSKDGKFSVLGNHDYAHYTNYSDEEKHKSLLRLIDFETQAGFEMLRNENRAIEKNGEKIYILGVENWGEPPFPQYGDLDKALEGVPENSVKILMSHDPTHFDKIVKHHPKNVQLTLSGHTHGMQFGIDLKNVKWSPIQYRYPKWADLYESMGKYLYVNRGFGVIGYPGRVGILPEITVFELD
ncbi:MAG: metallophosphoesterase [Flavobacteriaceae bacterium]|jgi:predicted MPP superfamily phosphohydrolase|nr:metallophosphoesterase [Flavobacteriaceae bacterium]